MILSDIVLTFFLTLGLMGPVCPRFHLLTPGIIVALISQCPGSRAELFVGVRSRLNLTELQLFTRGAPGAVSLVEYNSSVPLLLQAQNAATLPLNRTSWVLLQTSTSMVFTPTERDVELTYRFSLQTLQHPGNSGQNRPRGQHADLRLSVWVVALDGALPTTRDDVIALTESCGYSPALNRQRDFMEETCRAMRLYAPNNSENNYGQHQVSATIPDGNRSDAWATTALNFSVRRRCETCVVVFEVDQLEWVSYWGSEVYIADATIEREAVNVPSRVFVDGSHERVIMPVQATEPPPSAPTGCPHTAAGLILWHSRNTWPLGTVPVPDSRRVISLPTNARVLATALSFTATSNNPYGLIIVPATTELIFADDAVVLHVHELRVFGALRVGAPTCRMSGPIEFVFHGHKSSDAGVPGATNATSKGLIVLGGSVDVYGRKLSPTWTRLASTAFAGDDWMTLQANVSGSWAAGMEVLVTTTTFEDRADLQPQNEIRAITQVSGTRIRLNQTLFYRHHGGHEYQAEVAILDRSITFRGHLSGNDTHDGYGGHTRVSGSGASGHFSGICAIHMGQRSMIGRYPFHFHLIDYAPNRSGVLEVDTDDTSTTLLGTGWSNFTSAPQYAHLLGGRDGTVVKSTSPSAAVKFQTAVSTAGNYEVLLSKPANVFELTQVEFWNGHSLSRNVTVQVVQQGLTRTVTMDFAQHDPVDVHKQWVHALSLPLVPGEVNVTVRMEDASGTTRTLALDALWIRPDPNERYVVEDSVVTSSFFRCVTIHGTNNVRVSRNVAYSVSGNCFYFEDGVEERSIVEYNLAAHVHPIGRAASGGAQVGETFWQDSETNQPADHAAAGFYFTNARNTIRGNAASGGWTGFAFPNLPRPIGAWQNVNFFWFNPEQRKELQFDGNSAHSAGQDWVNGNCLYVGGRLTMESNGLLRYASGRVTRSTVDDFQARSYNNFTNLLVFLCRRGFNHWGNSADIEHFEAIDIMHGAVVFGDAYLAHGLFQATSSNPASGITSHLGFQFYDTWTRTMLDDVTFRGYHFVDGDRLDLTNPNRWSLTNRVIESMDHSDTFKPQGINAVRNITLESVDSLALMDMPGPDTGSGWMYNHVSFDGTLANRTMYSIVGSHTSWWNGSRACSVHPVWGIWVCSGTSDTTTIACLNVEIPKVTRNQWETGRIESHRHIGYVCQRSVTEVLAANRSPGPQGEDIDRCLLLTKNPITTGLANRVWFWRFLGGGVAYNTTSSGLVGWDASPRRLNITYTQISPGQFVVVAIPYPRNLTNAAFEVEFNLPYHGGTISIPAASSREHVLAPTEILRNDFDPASHCPPTNGTVRVTVCNRSNAGPLHFWDQPNGLLYVRVVNPSIYTSRFAANSIESNVFRRNGMWLNGIDNLNYYYVRVACPELGSSGLCRVRGNPIPAAARPSGDSCRVSPSQMILPARLNLDRTASFAWQTPSASAGGPSFGSSNYIPAGGMLSLSASRGDIIQVTSQADFDNCVTTSGRLLHDFQINGSAFDLTFDDSGVYFLTTTDFLACNAGLKLRLVVGEDPTTMQPASLLSTRDLDHVTYSHSSCTVVSDASGSTTRPPTTAFTTAPTASNVDLGSSSTSGNSNDSVLIVSSAAVALGFVIVVAMTIRKSWKPSSGDPSPTTPVVFNAYAENEAVCETTFTS